MHYHFSGDIIEFKITINSFYIVNIYAQLQYIQESFYNYIIYDLKNLVLYPLFDCSQSKYAQERRPYPISFQVQ